MKKEVNILEMTLRELCNALGVTRRMIQRYESYGLVSPCGKTDRGYLLYDDIAYNRAKKVKEYQMFGFTLKEISQFKTRSVEDKKEILLNQLEILKNNKKVIDETIQILEEEISEL